MTQSSLGTILLVCTSHADLGETGNKTGLWMEKLTAPYFAFLDAGYQIEIASLAGGTPPIDPGSMKKEMQGPSVARFDADAEANAKFEATTPLEDIADMSRFAAIFLAGGHGTMWDFPENNQLGSLVAEATKASKAVGAVCHGVAGLLAGDAPVALKGKSVAGFSNEEEAAVGLTAVVPFLLATRLEERGFTYSKGDVFTPYIVTDGLLVTGQNPMSSLATAEAMITVMAQA